MPRRFDPRLDVLPAAQKEIWTSLSAAPRLSFVLYGGTAVALHLGHRQSVDFDFFRTEPLDKDEVRAAFPFLAGSTVLQDTPNTLVVLAAMPSGPVKISFFGGMGIGRVSEPLQTRDGTLLVASLDDLMATKLKATLDRAEARDYRDIARMILAGVSLSAGLGAFKKMFKGEPSQVLRAIGYFKDGDLPALSKTDQQLLRNARNQIVEVPEVHVTPGPLAVPLGEC
jgi:Nucleotidyl transferase AbiEii toxin, Type IV TA system